MAYFALLWKGRTIEKYRINYENEKVESLISNHVDLPKKNLPEKHKQFQHATRKQMEQKLRQWCPTFIANFLFYLKTDQTFPNFLLKSALGFGGGIILTYLCFMFFVFQLSISLMHATIMSSVIGVLLTLGLAFSYRVRCLVFLLIPQLFSRVGRYTLTCYALILILTGPATNTLKNSEVLSESMACGQEQIKLHVKQLNDFLKNPLNLVKDSITKIVDRMKYTSAVFREMLHKTNRLALSIVKIFQSSFLWLHSTVPLCNQEFGTPYAHCVFMLDKEISRSNLTYSNDQESFYESRRIIEDICSNVKNYESVCLPQEYSSENIGALVKRRLKNFSEHIKAMLYVDVKIHHTYSYSSNVNKTAGQTAAGIVTEIRNRADPLITWLSWSSCGTSLFLVLIIFRAKYYQHMFETRSRFDNQYVTKELLDLDLKRQKQGRETILPLNRREQMKYISATSFKLVPSEKVYLSRSAVFMTITTFKLLIHIVADYSLFWILTIIRQHGRFQTTLPPGYTDAGIKASGTGPVVKFLQNIIDALNIPLAAPSPSPITCLPDPLPPNLRRYTQIGVLIVLLWLFALFEPYGLRLRHIIMGMYRPERAKARAAWLYNHILTTRGSFMKYARRKLHRQFKYSTENKHTFRYWLNSYIPFWWLQSLLGTAPDEPHCLLCSTKEIVTDRDTKLVRCETPECPGIFCVSCFSDIGQLCTICLPPADYGDISDVSLEKGSSDDDTHDDHDDAGAKCYTMTQLRRNYKTLSMFKNHKSKDRNIFSKTSRHGHENIPLLQRRISQEKFTEIKVKQLHIELIEDIQLKTKENVDINNNIIESIASHTKLKLNIETKYSQNGEEYYNKSDYYGDMKFYLDIKQFLTIKPNSHLIFVSDKFTPFMFDESLTDKLSRTKKVNAYDGCQGLKINCQGQSTTKKIRRRDVSCNNCSCLKNLFNFFLCSKKSVKSNRNNTKRQPTFSTSKSVVTKNVSYRKSRETKKRSSESSDKAINLYFRNVHYLNLQSRSRLGLFDSKGLVTFQKSDHKQSNDIHITDSCSNITNLKKDTEKLPGGVQGSEEGPVNSILNFKSCVNLKNDAASEDGKREQKNIRKHIKSEGAWKKKRVKNKSDAESHNEEPETKTDTLQNTTEKEPPIQHRERKLHKSKDVALSTSTINKTVDKVVFARPKVKTSACQCSVSNSVRSNKKKLSNKSDKRVKYSSSTCTCATQHYSENKDVGVSTHLHSPKSTKAKAFKFIEHEAKKMYQQEMFSDSEMSSISSSAYSRVINFVRMFKNNRRKVPRASTQTRNQACSTKDDDWWSPLVKKKDIKNSLDSAQCNSLKNTLDSGQCNCLKTQFVQKKNKPIVNNKKDINIETKARHHKKKIREPHFSPTWEKC